MVIGPSAGRAQGEEQAEEAEEQGEEPGKPLVVDTDVHEYFKGFRSLAPYMPAVHRQPIEEWGFSRIDTGFPYTSVSVKDGVETGNRYQSLMLGDERTPGFRSHRRQFLDDFPVLAFLGRGPGLLGVGLELYVSHLCATASAATNAKPQSK